MKTVPFFCLLGAVITAPHIAAGSATYVGWACAAIAALALALKTFLKDH